MSFASFEDTTGWGAPAAPTEEVDIVASAMKKERVIRDVTATQEDLRTMLARVRTVQDEVNKLTAGNQTLQMYIDNLTKQLARR